MEDEVTRLLSNIELWSSFPVGLWTFDWLKVSFFERPPPAPNFYAYLNLIESALLDEAYVPPCFPPFFSNYALRFAAISFYIILVLNDSELPRIFRFINPSFFITDSPFSIFRPFRGRSMPRPSRISELKHCAAYYYLLLLVSPCNVPLLLPGPGLSDIRPLSEEYGVVPSSVEVIIYVGFIGSIDLAKWCIFFDICFEFVCKTAVWQSLSFSVWKMLS